MNIKEIIERLEAGEYKPDEYQNYISQLQEYLRTKSWEAFKLAVENVNELTAMMVLGVDATKNTDVVEQIRIVGFSKDTEISVPLTKKHHRLLSYYARLSGQTVSDLAGAILYQFLSVIEKMEGVGD